MMRLLTIAILFISLNHPAFSYTFLDVYKNFRLERANAISSPKTKKEIKRFIKSQILELDTVLQSYKTRTGFDFNTADTLFLIYESGPMSPFTGLVTIWSGNDTIAYMQGFEIVEPSKYKRIITYVTLSETEIKEGFKVVTERDSLMTLVSKRDYTTINHLGDNQNIDDGSYHQIYVAYKNKGRYLIEYCFPRQFIIRDTYRKE
jgi:hypothetical protein